MDSMIKAGRRFFSSLISRLSPGSQRTVWREKWANQQPRPFETMTPEQFAELEGAIEEIELARIEYESGPQKARLERARDSIETLLKAYEDVPSVQPIG
jgi:hypothetical protein